MIDASLFYHPDCTLHDVGPQHPESPQRLKAILEHLKQTGLLQDLTVCAPTSASYNEVTRVHPVAYVESLQSRSPATGLVQVDADTIMMRHSLDAAWLAAGAAVQATNAVLEGQCQTAFCATRPPGHHAERNRSMGFCFFNNVAIAARHALDHHGLERVAIVDFDVHQGNGTIDIFQDDPRVLVCSSFQHPLYPFSHVEVDRPNIVNTPFPSGTDGRRYRRRIEEEWLHRLQDHRPQLILISAGFDAHKADPLAGMNLLEEDYAWITSLLGDVARIYCKGRMVSMLEGGYDLGALARSVASHVAVLADE